LNDALMQLFQVQDYRLKVDATVVQNKMLKFLPEDLAINMREKFSLQRTGEMSNPQIPTPVVKSIYNSRSPHSYTSTATATSPTSLQSAGRSAFKTQTISSPDLTYFQ